MPRHCHDCRYHTQSCASLTSTNCTTLLARPPLPSLRESIAVSAGTAWSLHTPIRGSRNASATPCGREAALGAPLQNMGCTFRCRSVGHHNELTRQAPGVEVKYMHRLTEVLRAMIMQAFVFSSKIVCSSEHMQPRKKALLCRLQQGPVSVCSLASCKHARW